MLPQTYPVFCHKLAKALSMGVRLYQGEQPLFYYSIYHLHPDPATTYLSYMLEAGRPAGVITTPLYQFYGFIVLPNNYRIVLGPTRILQASPRETQEMLFLLGVEPDKKTEYERLLHSAPLIDAERFAWLLAALATALLGCEFPVEDVWVQVRPTDSSHVVQAAYIQKHVAAFDDPTAQQAAQQSYAWELLVSSYIEAGQPDMVCDLFSAPPSIEAGRMAQDTLRQAKNAGITAAAIAARTAMKGGVDSSDAFRMSDLYIQRLELLRDVPSIDKLIQEMLIDYAQRVKNIKYGAQAGSRLFALCAQYVSQNIFSPIRAQEVASALGYTRAYLCNQFSRQSGMALTQYILQEKILESKRMLQFTDRRLCDIAALFGFSSQSHFQTVFKKITGTTPTAYRKETKIDSP